MRNDRPQAGRGHSLEHWIDQRIAGQNERAEFFVVDMVHQIARPGNGWDGNDGKKADVPVRLGKADADGLDPALGDPCYKAEAGRAEAEHAQTDGADTRVAQRLRADVFAVRRLCAVRRAHEQQSQHQCPNRKQQTQPPDAAPAEALC